MPDSCGPVSCVVIVGVAVDDDAASFYLVAKIHPTAQFSGAVHDGFIPRSGLQFDAFAVAQPANVSPVCGDGIKFLCKFFRPRHVRQIRQDQRNFVLAKQIREFCVKPFGIANFDSVLAAARQFIQKRHEPVGKSVAVRKHAGTELGKLKQDGPELGAKNVHGGKKFIEFRVAVHENFVVGDAARSLDGENKIVRGFRGPIGDGARA